MLRPENLRPGDLVAVASAPGPDWVGLIRDVWERGAAILPLDDRMSEPERREVVRQARPTFLVDRDGCATLDGGEPAEGIALVMHTSGTAGVPKLVELEASAIDNAVESSAIALAATPNDRWLCCLPVAHVGGLLVLLRAVLLGAPVIAHERFDARAVADADAAFTSLVPTMLARLLELPADLRRFRSILVGGAAVSETLEERARRGGAPVVRTYGLTETCGGVVYDGRPIAGAKVRVTDGGIELRGPTTMRGYRLDPRATQAAFTADGWLRTGDSGRLDAEGRLHVEGRADDIIDTGGEKVWPEEVEAALSSHPGVAEVAVVGVADREWGRRVVAFVVARDKSAPPSLGELRDHASAAIARFKAPRELVLVDELPRTVSGKVRRGALTASGE